ncbi:MAG: DUF3169 family protein [Lachnospiraceae bacterium]|nr:DUF3169 family protein [Lachnospiraceae bacterium]
MSTEERIKKEDKKAVGKFRWIMAACTLLGALGGIALAFIRENDAGIVAAMAKLPKVMIYVIPVLFILTNIVTGIICIHMLRKTEKIRKVWDGEEEEPERKMDKCLDISMFLTNIVCIINLFLFGVEVYFLNRGEGRQYGFFLMAAGVVIILSQLFNMLLQKKTVNLIKLINPEKRGSVYDVHFMKKWEESSDELQMLIMYRAGYRSYKTMQITCIVLWVICFFLNFSFDTGLLPMLCVTILWLISIITFMLTCRKLENTY